VIIILGLNECLLCPPPLYEFGQASGGKNTALAIAVDFFPHLYQLAKETVITLSGCPASVQSGFG